MLKGMLSTISRWGAWQSTRPGDLARFSIVLLSLSTCWGVYHFSTVLVSKPVALLSAAAFESAYIGLAYLDLPGDQLRRARRLGLTAMACSIVFNVLSGVSTFQPELFVSPPLWLAIALAVVHAFPLSWLAYQLADLVLHGSPRQQTNEHDAGTQPLLPAVTGQGERRYPCPGCREPLTQGEYGSAMRRGYCRQCKEGVAATHKQVAA